MADPEIRIRPMTELDIESIAQIDERIIGSYRPHVWEERIGYYIRRDPDASHVAELDGKVIGFMMGEVRAGEFGLEEPTGWIDFVGVDPGVQSKGIGRRLIEALLAHFREQGALVARTEVRLRDEQILRFFRAMGFADAAVVALERRLA